VDSIPAEKLVQLLFEYHERVGRPRSGDLLAHFKAIDQLFDLEKRVQAAKRYLALEPVYRGEGSGGQYASYLEVIVGNDQIFNIPGNVVVSAGRMQEMLDAMRKMVGEDPGALDFLVRGLLHRAQDDAGKLAVLRRNARILTRDRFRDMLALGKGAELDALVDAWLKGRGRKQQVDFNTSLMPDYGAYGKKDRLKGPPTST
jgi:hypothetical protein